MVLKLQARLLIARTAGACTRDRGNWEALKKLEGRTARVATRKMEVEDMMSRENGSGPANWRAEGRENLSGNREGGCSDVTTKFKTRQDNTAGCTRILRVV